MDKHGNVLLEGSFSAVLGSEEFVPAIKEKFIIESGVTQAFQRISIRIREDKHLRKGVKFIEKKISL